MFYFLRGVVRLCCLSAGAAAFEGFGFFSPPSKDEARIAGKSVETSDFAGRTQLDPVQPT